MQRQPAEGAAPTDATLARVGERRLLDQLVERGSAAQPWVVLGPGDDAAVLTPTPGTDLVVSQDALVEGVDFLPGQMDGRTLGRRALHVALSDLAGMGALPRGCLATVCAVPEFSADRLLEIQAGLLEAGVEEGCPLVGGDLSSTAGPLVIDVVVLGECPAGQRLLRSAGRPGDLLVVTGRLGLAAAGLRHLLDDRQPCRPEWIEAQQRPRARVAEGRRALRAGVACGGDLSDGLWVEVQRTATAAGCGAEVWADSLPAGDGIRELPDWRDLVLGGGEDFELLLAVAQDRLPVLEAGWAPLAPLRVVGQLRPGTGVVLLDTQGGAEMPPPRVLSQHFG